MSPWQIAVGILLFALVSAILYAWGLAKAADQEDTLHRNLMHACGSRVLKQLKKQETITEGEIARLIEGVSVGQFWSRNKMKVQDGKTVAPQVIEFLLDQQYIESAGRNTYRRKP
ncbi:MAG: hypothetical protein IKU62_02475 [Ruminiclostridium sp.]|nr:hypothetical protein [Ruminiclostridium sp.]